MTKQEYLTKGFQYFSNKEYNEAAEVFKMAIKIDDTFEAAYSALSESLNRMGKIDEAIPVVKKWIELNNNDPLAHTALSRLYVQKGMIKEAEEEMAISNYLSQQS
jgi:tetratricopeptide (TPR) repeat protein